jgi:hypothetical protein
VPSAPIASDNAATLLHTILAMATTFSFQMRTYAAAHFELDQVLKINFPSTVAVLQSEYTGGKDGRAYPITIFGEIRGEFDDLHEAQARLSGLIGGYLLPVISIATNAAVEMPMAIACFGVNLTEPQPFLGYRTPPAEDFFPPGKRRIQIDPLVAYMEAVGTQAETALLRRANEAFRHALLHWAPEERLLGGEFLFIAAETLSRFLLESRAKERGITPKNLARAEGAKNAGDLRSRFLSEIFNGDEEALTNLERASSGFEHGYMATHSVHGLMEPVSERSLACIRSALIRASGVDDAVVKLLSDDYSEPRPLIPTLHVLEGELLRSDPSVPIKEDLPWGMIDLKWKGGKPVASEKDEDVQYAFNWEIEISNLPDNTSLRPTRHGLRAGYITPWAEADE